jgi:Undecaprenyl-phosphate glucose phosphotransferase
MSLAHKDDFIAGRVLSSHRRSALAVSFEAIPPLVAAFDVAWVLLLGAGVGLGYHLIAHSSVGDIWSYVGSGMAVATLFCTVSQAAGLYRPSNLLRVWSQIRRAVFIWTMVFGCLTAIVFLLKIGAIFSRVTVLLFFAGGLSSIALSRLVIARTLAHVIAIGALARRRVVLVGAASEVGSNRLLGTIERYGYVIARVFVLPDETASAQAASGEAASGAAASGAAASGAAASGAAGSLVTQRMNEVVDYARSSAVDEVVLALPWASSDLIDRAEAALQVLPIPVKLVPDAHVARFFDRPLFEFGPTKAVELQRAPLTAAQRVLKQSLDFCLAAAGLVLLLPMLCVLALAIRMETPGPAFFFQSRVGFNGQAFRIFKFRTMSTLDDGPDVRQARRNDPRVTPLGRLLRALSIDEIPQLLNVLRGEMSLIGPRPHALAHDDEYGRLIATYAIRRKIKPGLTGWAQVNGCRGETPSVEIMQHRVEHDLWYIEYWSFWLDVRIVLMTVVQLLRPRNVY